MADAPGAHRLSRSEFKTRKVERIARIGNWEWNVLTNELVWSDEVFRLYGMDPARDAPTFDLVLQTLAPEDRDRFLKAVDAAITAGAPFDGEYRMIGLDGAERFTHTVGEVVRDPDGRPLSMFGVVQEVTERKRAEAALRESEERLNTILENVGAAIFIKDARSRYTYVNRRAAEILGAPATEILGRGDDAFFPPGSVQAILADDRAVIERGEAVSREETIPLRTAGEAGSRTYWTVKLPLRDAGGAISGVCGISTDISDRKKAEQQLAHMHDLMQYVISHAQSAIAVHDRELKYVYVSEPYRRQYNVKEADVIGKHHYEVFPELPQKWRDVHRRVLAGAVESRDEDDYVRADGSVDWTRWECRPWYERDGSIGGLIVYTEVITERKRREEALRESELRLRDCQRAARIGSWSWDLVDDRLHWSDEMFRRFDKTPGSFVPTIGYFAERMHAEDRAAFERAVHASPGEDVRYHGQVRVTNESGRAWVMEAFGSLARNPEGRPVRFEGTAQDVTEQKLAEGRIRDSEEFVRSILDTVDEGFLVVTPDYRIVSANKAYAAQVGRPVAELIGTRCFEASHHAVRPCGDACEDCPVKDVFATGQPSIAAHRHLDNEGHVVYVETKAFPLRDAQGRVVSAIATVNNITERHLLEEERLKSQKLESIGTLAGGIAHDFNNLLQGVSSYVSAARLGVHDPERDASLEEAQRGLALARKLTQQLLTFSKGGRPVKCPLDLRPVLESAVTFALSGSRSDCRIALDGPLCVEADEGQITQVFHNVVLNAEQAMPVGGTVQVAARQVCVPQDEAPASLAAGTYVEVAVTDAGVGIPEEHRSRIFDPYFTTKEKGSGLGLATSYSIVKSHGGAIAVRSRPGSGTTFLIYLPAAVSAPAKPPLEPPCPALQPRRVLVMDDDDLVRLATVRLLRALGHEVESAQDGEETLEKYRAAIAAGARFDVVLLDLTVRSGMGGAEAICHLRALDPQVKSIISSGYAEEAAVARCRQHGFDAFLQKPYDIGQLREVLARLLS